MVAPRRTKMIYAYLANCLTHSNNYYHIGRNARRKMIPIEYSIHDMTKMFQNLVMLQVKIVPIN